MTPPTDPPIHPHPHHGWGVGGGISTNDKSSNRIELFQLGQDF